MVINYPDGLGVDAEMVYQLLWLLSLYLAMIGGEDITPPPQLQECFDSSHLHIGPETKPFSRRFFSPLLFSSFLSLLSLLLSGPYSLRLSSFFFSLASPSLITHFPRLSSSFPHSTLPLLPSPPLPSSLPSLFFSDLGKSYFACVCIDTYLPGRR